MKKNRLFWAASLIVALVGCRNGNQVNTLDLEVLEQTDTVYRNDTLYDKAIFVVDVPLKGPKLLMDSVMAFVNKQLYDACEGCVHIDDRMTSYRQDEVFSVDGENILGQYMDKYRTLIADSIWKVYGCELKMEAQTKKLVTFGVEHFHCGGSCGSEKYYYTFDKSNGHQVRDIISRDNLDRFFRDYPEYTSVDEDPWLGSAGWHYFPEDGFHSYDYGLLDDHFTLAIQGCGNHYLLLSFPYGQIFSYLSPEAQALVERHEENRPMLPAYLSHMNPDVNLEVDSVNHALIGCVSAAGGDIRDTLLHYDPAQEIHPKLVYTIGIPLFLLTYSFGHLLFRDEAMTCTLDDSSHLRPVSLFSMEGRKDSIVSCVWYDKLKEAGGVFPFDEFDENRFGLHYDWVTNRLYYPILESHGPTLEAAGQYTGRFEVFQFNGEEFVHAGEDGAWWLEKELRNYGRTVRNRRTTDGIEQVDLMPDGTYRRASWKGAKTLDDLRKKPDEVMVSKNMDEL